MLVADGRSTAAVTLCGTDDAGRDPMLTGTLAATSGDWIAAPDGGVQKATFGLDRDGCRTMRWRASQSLDSPVITGTVGDPPYAVATTSILLVAAALEQPVLSIDGRVAQDGASSLTVTANLRAKTGGAPTLGTWVDYTVLAQPAGVAYFTAPRSMLTTGNSVASTLLVSGTAIASVTVRVVATSLDGTSSPAASLTIPTL
jgi:hypothetical protein